MSRSSTLQPWSSAGMHRLKRCEKGNRISREIAFPNEIWEREEMFEFNIPTGFRNKAQGCGTPLPWVGKCPQFPFTPKGLRHMDANAVWENRRNSVGVEKREGETSLTQGSGVPQPWAMICNPIGILNTYVGISIPHPERKDVGNDKSCTWERFCTPVGRPYCEK